MAICEEGTVANTLAQLRESPATTKAKAKFILTTGGKESWAIALPKTSPSGRVYVPASLVKKVTKKNPVI